LSNTLNRLWAYRGFIWQSVKREFTLRYHDSVLGAAWIILNPLAMILIYTIIFAKVMQARLPNAQSSFAYSIFLMSGILPWGLFSDLISRAPSLFIEQASLLKKIQFPKLALVAMALLNSLVNFAVIFSLFMIFFDRLWSASRLVYCGCDSFVVITALDWHGSIGDPGYSQYIF